MVDIRLGGAHRSASHSFMLPFRYELLNCHVQSKNQMEDINQQIPRVSPLGRLQTSRQKDTVVWKINRTIKG